MLLQTVQSFSRSGLLAISLLANLALFLYFVFSSQIYNGGDGRSEYEYYTKSSIHFTQKPLPYPSMSAIRQPEGKPTVLVPPTIFAITPTYTRQVQKAELTRLMQTFRQVPNFHWIVVEDAEETSPMVQELLARSTIDHTHLNILTNKTAVKGRGFPQRNLGLEHLRTEYPDSTTGPPGGGVVYFADDDNVYDLRLFEQIRWIKTLGFGPVGLVGGILLEKPHIKDGKITGWDVQYAKHMKMRSDMAGFAFNLQLVLDNPTILFKMNSLPGYYETDFLNSFKIDRANCEYYGMDNQNPRGQHEVLVWHTRTSNPREDQEKNYLKRTGHNSNWYWEI